MQRQPPAEGGHVDHRHQAGGDGNPQRDGRQAGDQGRAAQLAELDAGQASAGHAQRPEWRQPTPALPGLSQQAGQQGQGRHGEGQGVESPSDGEGALEDLGRERLDLALVDQRLRIQRETRGERLREGCRARLGLVLPAGRRCGEHDAQRPRRGGEAFAQRGAGEQHLAARIAVVGVDGGHRYRLSAARRAENQAVARTNALAEGQLFVDECVALLESRPGGVPSRASREQWPGRRETSPRGNAEQ